jgi:sulfur carrier protein ThiS
MLKKQKTEQQPIEGENAQNTHSKKTLIDEVEIVRFLMGGLAAK